MLKKLTIKTRLVLSFSILVLALVGLGLYSINSVNKVNLQSTLISDEWLPAMDAAHTLNTLTSDYRTSELRYVMSGEKPELLAQMKERLEEDGQLLQQQIADYEPRLQGEEDKGLYEKFKQEWSDYLNTGEQVRTLVSQHQTDEAMDLIAGESKTEFDEASNMLMELVKFNQKNAVVESNEADALYSSTFGVLITIIIVMGLVAVGLAILIVLSIIRPIGKLSQAAEALALGDVNVSVETNSQDEIGKLMQVFSRMIASIRDQAAGDGGSEQRDPGQHQYGCRSGRFRFEAGFRFQHRIVSRRHRTSEFR